MAKKNVLVIYGGKSTEHEISRRSAAFVFKNIDYNRYHVEALGIGNDGIWYPQDVQSLRQHQQQGPLPLKESTLPLSPLMQVLLPSLSPKELAEKQQLAAATAVFPVLHGTNGEDGTLQGMCDLAGVAYVGADTLGSAAAMDKVVAKKLVADAGIPVVPYVAFRRFTWEAERQAILDRIHKQLGETCFVKPASLGSSVGVKKAKGREAMASAIQEAFAVDEKVLVETAMEIREIEYACLGGYDPAMTDAGEIVTKDGFYDFDAKYVSATAADVKVPADLPADLMRQGQDLARRVFIALELYGLARIDLFLTKKDQRFYFNEANTLPGMTSISQYPMLWAAAGVPARELLDRLLGVAWERAALRRALSRVRGV